MKVIYCIEIYTVFKFCIKILSRKSYTVLSLPKEKTVLNQLLIHCFLNTRLNFDAKKNMDQVVLLTQNIKDSFAPKKTGVIFVNLTVTYDTVTLPASC